jgi:hypothetical protein
MHQIFVYADSLSWGIISDTRSRFRFDKRWPGIVELQRFGISVRVIEDCLNGRSTVWKDPFKPGRNGLEGLEQRIEINSPIFLVVVFLGTNDFPLIAAPEIVEVLCPDLSVTGWCSLWATWKYSTTEPSFFLRRAVRRYMHT